MSKLNIFDEGFSTVVLDSLGSSIIHNDNRSWERKAKETSKEETEEVAEETKPSSEEKPKKGKGKDKPKKKDKEDDKDDEEKEPEEPKEEFTEIDISGTIDEGLVRSLLRQLSTNVKNEDRKRILMRIVSGGGSVSAGNSAIGILEAWNKPILTICAGTVASMAVDLCIIGDLRLAYRGTRFMIHSMSSFSYGDESQMVKDLARIREDNKTYEELYLKHVGLTKGEFNRLQKGDNYMNVEQALNLGTKGLIDGIIINTLENHKVEVLMRNDVVKVIDLYNDDLKEIKSTLLENIEKTTETSTEE